MRSDLPENSGPTTDQLWFSASNLLGLEFSKGSTGHITIASIRRDLGYAHTNGTTLSPRLSTYCERRKSFFWSHRLYPCIVKMLTSTSFHDASSSNNSLGIDESLMNWLGP